MPEEKKVTIPEIQEEDKKSEVKKDPFPQTADEHNYPISLNEELTEKIKDDPNRFIGCGG